MTHSKPGSPISLQHFKLSLVAGCARLGKASVIDVKQLDEKHSIPPSVSVPDFAVKAFIAHLSPGPPNSQFSDYSVMPPHGSL